MNIKRNRKQNKVILAVILPIVLAATGVIGFFGYKMYEKSAEDKIYAPNEMVSFPDFDFTVTKAEFKSVNLPLEQKTIQKWGGIDKQEDCEKFSKENRYNMTGGLGWAKYGPSDYNVCNRRNISRDEIKKYTAKNKQLVVDYTIAAKNNVDTRNISIFIEADSGRNLTDQVDTFNTNQFFEGGAQELIPPIGDAPGEWYPDELPQKYKPFHKSALGGNINKGLTRKGYAYTDIRNDEHSIDIKITYNKNQVRIVRIAKH